MRGRNRRVKACAIGYVSFFVKIVPYATLTPTHPGLERHPTRSAADRAELSTAPRSTAGPVDERLRGRREELVS